MLKEWNIIVKKPKKGMYRIAIIFPSTYAASLSNLFNHYVYYYLNTFPEIYAERFTLDNPTWSLETKTPLKKFDIALISLPFELMYQNFIRILIINKIEPNRSKRNLKKPILIGGGPAVSSNPLPLRDILDAIVIGEGEEFIEKLINHLPLISNTREFVEKIASLPGVFSGWFPKSKVKKIFVKNLDDTFYPITQIQSSVEPVYGKGFLMEVSRGCFRLCSFCLEAHVFFPYRFRSYNTVNKLIEKGLKVNNLKRVVFYSLSFFDWPYSNKLLEKMINQEIKFNVPSLRLDTLNEDRLELIKDGGQKTIAIAPETLSGKLGCLIRKKFKYEFVKEIVLKALSKGLNVKLYFIIGLPYETFDDVKLIPQFINEIIKEGRMVRPKQIRITINPLIPKANTPFQYFAMDSLDNLKEKIRIINGLISKKYVNIDIYDLKWAVIQAAIALGSANLGKVLILWANYGGTLPAWRKAINEVNYNINYIFKPRNVDIELPWEFIDLGFRSYLKYSYLKFKECII